MNIHETMSRRVANLRQQGRWYDIVNAAGDDDSPAKVRIYGPIGGWFGDVSATDLVEDLDAIDADEIVVSINSPGGDVFDGIAIYNALRQHPAHVTTRVDSLAASIASVIAQAGDHRQMVESSQMMVHQAWGLCIGNAAEMRELADLLDRQDDVIAGIYTARADADDAARFRELMDAETWLTAEEAVDEGLADEVVTPPRQTSADDPQDSRKRSRLTDQLDGIADSVDDAVNRLTDLAALRSEQGKPVDDGWQTRPHVDRFTAALNRLVDALTPDESDAEPVTDDDAGTPTTNTDAATDAYLAYVAATLNEE